MDFYLCNYPFLFDAKAKTLLLELDQSIQMSVAAQPVSSSSSIFYEGSLGIANLLPFLQNVTQQAQPRFVQLTVSRDNLVQDTIKEISVYSKGELKRPLRIKFTGEEAEDAGSLNFRLLCRIFAYFFSSIHRRRSKGIFHVITERLIGSQIWHVQRIRGLTGYLVCRSFV